MYRGFRNKKESAKVYNYRRLQCELKPEHKFGSKKTKRKRKKEANCAAFKGKEEACSRIDTIWVDGYWKQSVLICKTKDMELRMGTELNKELKRKFLKNSEKESIQSDVLDHYILKNKTLDELWDIIKSSIKKSAASKLPQKKKTR
ncbi:23229_t:CDS:2, partial [Gigaspora margarita]